jgi:hypothetical protein
MARARALTMLLLFLASCAPAGAAVETEAPPEPQPSGIETILPSAVAVSEGGTLETVTVVLHRVRGYEGDIDFRVIDMPPTLHLDWRSERAEQTARRS